MDVLNSKPIPRRKELICSEDWITLTEDILVLFGQNFGSGIRPVSGVSVCRTWNPISSGKDYLTASVPCLQQLSEESGT